MDFEALISRNRVGDSGMAPFRAYRSLVGTKVQKQKGQNSKPKGSCNPDRGKVQFSSMDSTSHGGISKFGAQ